VNPPSAVLLFVIAVFLAVLAALIGRYGSMELIAGYDADRVTDEGELRLFMGWYTLYAAALVFVVGVAEGVTPTGTTWYWIPFVAGIVALCVQMIRGARRYEGEDGT